MGGCSRIGGGARDKCGFRRKLWLSDSYPRAACYPTDIRMHACQVKLYFQFLLLKFSEQVKYFEQ